MEQALVFASIILGVAIALELTNLDKVMRSDKVKWHWAQPLFAVFVLLSITAFWWQIAGRPDGPISLGQFLPVMAQLVALTLMAAVALPDSIPEEGIDLAEYYQQNRFYQWLLVAIYFWIVHIGYLIYSWRITDSWLEFLSFVGPDTVAAFLLVGMMFARKWWMIAVGFGILSLAPIIWAARTL